jgi:hypothetical protein
LVEETESPEEWEEHVAYCRYIAATQAWFAMGCCDEDEIGLPCSDTEHETEEIAEGDCASP